MARKDSNLKGNNKMSLKMLPSSLTARILIPLILALSIMGFGLYYFNLRLISGFINENIKTTLHNYARDIYNICDRHLTQYIEQGTLDTTAERIAQVSAIREIESFAQRHDLIVSLTASGNLQLISSPLISRERFYEVMHKKDKPSIGTIDIGQNRYHAYQIDFTPWRWHFDIAVDEQAFSALTKQINQIYLYTILIALVSMAILFYAIHSYVISPLTVIMSFIKDKQRPQYRGIKEFEFLSNTISAMMDSIESNEEFLRDVTSGLGEGLIVIDKSNNLIYMNPPAEKMLQWQFIDMHGKDVYNTIHSHPEHKEFFYTDEDRPITNVIKTGIPYTTEDDYFLRKDGSLMPVSYIASPLIRSDDIKGVVVSFRDISERKRFEEERQGLQNQLYHSQKMEAVGLLAGGVAHDFNNMLTVIMGYCGLAKMQVKEDSTIHRYIDNILNSSERASNLTKQLLTFSRKQTPSLKPVDINQVVHNLQRLIAKLIGEHIEVKTIFSSDSLTVMADSGQIEQAIINLSTNARDAMPKGGTLTIETGSFYVDDAYAKRRMLKTAGLYAVISVSDTGVGIPNDIISNIFDPFFTTKEAGKGTGLGLSIVYGIAKQHNGDVRVYSDPSKGTVFKIYLPITGNVHDNKEVLQRIEQPSGGSETILLAEDDKDVLEIMMISLEGAGYTLIEAADGMDAVEKARTYKGKIDLFLSDIVMPKKNGRDAYIEIREFLPDIKVMFMSGYTADIIDRSTDDIKAIEVLSKPISQSELLLKVRQCLDRTCGTVC